MDLPPASAYVLSTVIAASIATIIDAIRLGARLPNVRIYGAMSCDESHASRSGGPADATGLNQNGEAMVRSWKSDSSHAGAPLLLNASSLAHGFPPPYRESCPNLEPWAITQL